MAEKNTDTIGVSHNEKDTIREPEPEKGDASGRRQSVALNIVQNPLKVCQPRLRFNLLTSFSSA